MTPETADLYNDLVRAITFYNDDGIKCPVIIETLNQVQLYTIDKPDKYPYQYNYLQTLRERLQRFGIQLAHERGRTELMLI